MLGVTPAEPGFGAVRVAPRPGALESVRGAAPTPHGLVHVQASGGVVEVRSPVPVVLVALDGSTTRLPAGVHLRDLATGEHPTE